MSTPVGEAFGTGPTGQPPKKQALPWRKEGFDPSKGSPLVLGLEMPLGCPWSGNDGEG